MDTMMVFGRARNYTGRPQARGAVLAVALGVILCIAPFLPFDRTKAGSVSEISILVWPDKPFIIGLGAIILLAAVVALRAREAIRFFCLGFMVVPAVTAATIQAVQLVSLHYGAGLRLSAMSAGSWALALACIGCLVVAGYGCARDDPHAELTVSTPQPSPWVLVTAIVVCGGIMLEWLVAPLAISGAGFVPYGSQAHVTDVYGALAYISYGAIAPQAAAGLGLSITLSVTVLACGWRGPRAAGILSGAAAAAALDTLGRFAEYLHPAPTVTVRPIPWATTALAALVTGLIARSVGAGSRARVANPAVRGE